MITLSFAKGVYYHQKLKDNLDLLKAYNDIFIEQKQNGIIEKVMSPGKLGETHYIPHHPVTRDDKTTTKIGIALTLLQGTMDRV